MKKAAVIAILLLSAVSAYAKKAKVFVDNADDKGDYVSIRIERAGDGESIKCQMAADGTIEQLSILSNTKGYEGPSFEFNISFLDSKANSIQYYVLKSGSSYVETYAKNHGNDLLFGLVDMLVANLYKDYDLARLAKEACKKQHAKYLKKEQKKKRRQEELRKQFPPPESLLRKFLEKR